MLRQFLNLEFIEAAKLMNTHINASRDNYKNTRERGERERERERGEERGKKKLYTERKAYRSFMTSTPSLKTYLCPETIDII